MADFAIARLSSLRSLGFAAIGAAYVVIGTPLDRPMRVIKLINTTDADMYVSFDGATDNDLLPASGGFTLYDLYTNSLTLQNLTQLYIKQVSAPSKGAVYLVGIYGKG